MNISTSPQDNDDIDEMERIAKDLRSKSNLVLEKWAERVRTQFPSIRRTSKPALYNALPAFLDEIAESISPRSSKTIPTTETCREHGEQRAGLVDFALRHIIEEYSVLRETILELLETNGPLPIKARNIILSSISRGVCEAATEYSRIQDSIREEFVAIITHDLRNPLSAAKTSSQMIHRVLNNPDKTATLASRSVASIKRIEIMLQDLLDTFQIRAGKPLPIDIRPADIKKIAQEAVEELTTIHGARFILKAPESVPAQVCSDGIRRTIENLANNAVKYGDPTTPITIAVDQPESNKVTISVHNFGNPLITEDQAKLFKPFHRAPFAKTSGHKGWGLGLVLVQGVTEAHHGEVSVKSTMEDGTTFTVMLPREPASVPSKSA